MTYHKWGIALIKATCLTDKYTLKDLHVKRTGWFKILLLQCIIQDSVSYVVVCYLILHSIQLKAIKQIVLSVTVVHGHCSDL
jgi:hypothetical protein